MTKISRASRVLLALAFSSGVFAADMDTRVKDLEMKMEKVYTKTAADSEGAKTAMGRPDPDGMGWFLNVDVIYWHAKVGGTEYAATTDFLGLNRVYQNGSNREVDLDWTWGFEIGVGYRFCHDGWDTHLEYTYFRPSSSSKVSVGSTAGVYALRAENQITSSSLALATLANESFAFATTASANLNFSYDNINWDLGRDFYVSKNLSLKPHFGLRTMWIDLKETTQYTGGSSITDGTTVLAGLGNNTVAVLDKSKFWGLGVGTGLDSKWHLTNGFSIYGKMSGALMYGNFEVDHETTFTGLPLNLISVSQGFHRIVPGAELILGLCYDQYICSEKQHIGVALGYDTQYLWRANQMLEAYQDGRIQKHQSVSEDISIQGVTFELRWDF